MKRIILVTIVLVAVVLAIENSDVRVLTKSNAKTITQKINYQGYLTNSSNEPITHPSLAITFKIYDDEFAGSVQWEATKSVSVENGVFSTLLDVPANVFTAGAPRWLELTIGGNALTPRTELTAVGYSYKTIDADKLQGLAPSEFIKNGDAASGDLTGTYPSPTIADNAVTTNKIANGNVTMTKIEQAGATTGQVIKWNGSAWSPADDNTGGGGTVSSVGLSMPEQFSVSGSPVTTSGILTASWNNQSSNVVFAGPSSEKDGAPTFRTLVPADIPNLDASKITSGVLPIAQGGTNSGTALNNNRIMVSNSGAITEAPALTNGQLLIGSSNTAPVAANITAGTGISVTNGAGSITISTSGGPFLPLAGGTMTGPITNTGDPEITMGKGNFGSGNINTGTMAFVAGSNNRARGDYSVISGGGGPDASDSNSATCSWSSIGGGEK